MKFLTNISLIGYRRYLLRRFDNLLRRLPMGIGPGLTVAFLLATWLLDAGNVVQFSLAPAFVIVVFAVYCGGWLCGNLSAGLVTGYELILWSNGDVSTARSLTVSISAWLIVLLVGLLNDRAALVDNASSLLARLNLAIEAEDDNIKSAGAILFWIDRQHEGEEQLLQIRVMLEQLHRRMSENRHHLAHLVTLVFGWLAIKKEIDKSASN